MPVPPRRHGPAGMVQPAGPRRSSVARRGPGAAPARAGPAVASPMLSSRRHGHPPGRGRWRSGPRGADGRVVTESRAARDRGAETEARASTRPWSRSRCVAGWTPSTSSWPVIRTTSSPWSTASCRTATRPPTRSRRPSSAPTAIWSRSGAAASEAGWAGSPSTRPWTCSGRAAAGRSSPTRSSRTTAGSRRPGLRPSRSAGPRRRAFEGPGSSAGRSAIRAAQLHRPVRRGRLRLRARSPGSCGSRSGR